MNLSQAPAQASVGTMPANLSFGGRIFSQQELELMRDIAQDYAGLALTEMARTTCELLDWKRPNGRLKDLECRQLLEHLEAQGWDRADHDRSSSRQPVRRQTRWKEPPGSLSPWSCRWSRTNPRVGYGPS